MEGDNIYYQAEEGKVFKRILDGETLGNEIWLGYRFLEDGTPIKETIEDFEQVDKPE